MGGLNFGICFDTGKHEEGSPCEYANRDEIIHELINEIRLLADGEDTSSDSDSAEPDALENAEKLHSSLNAFEKTKCMQFFREEWPTYRLSIEERIALIGKSRGIYKNYDEKSLCEHCRKNLFCLASCLFIAIQDIAENYEQSTRAADTTPEQVKYFEDLEARVQTLEDRAIYIQSRTYDLYYGNLLHSK